MKSLTLQPIKHPLSALVKIPGSKSYTQRSLIITSLARGRSIIINPCICDDTTFLIDALKVLGVSITQVKDRNHSQIIVHGSGGSFVPSPSTTKLFVGDSGTALRFLTALSSLVSGTIIIAGNPRLCQRPIQELVDVLSHLGINIESSVGSSPIIIKGGHLHGGVCSLSGEISSQYLSALLMVLPYAEQPSRILLNKEPVSLPYINMTLKAMQSFGSTVVQTHLKKYSEFFVRPGVYDACHYVVEPDATSASYFFGAAAVCGGTVTIPLNPHTLQGDIQFVDLLQQMGCTVKKLTGSSLGVVAEITVTGNPDNFCGITIDMRSMPDIVPTLAVVAACARGTTTLTNIGHLRYKESDRCDALYRELSRLGVGVTLTQDSLSIEGSPSILEKNFLNVDVETYDDHRIAMSFAMLGLCTGITLKNPDCVNKSFPLFWDTLYKLYESVA